MSWRARLRAATDAAARAAGRPHDAAWSIGLAVGPDPLHLLPAATPVLTRRDVTDVRADFVADPFVIRAEDGTYHALFEVLERWTRRGVIAHATSTDLERWSYQRVVLRTDFHLSFPYTFRWEGATYVLPEAGESRAVTLYRGEPFPDRLVPVATLLEGWCVDTVLFPHDDRWWLLTSRGSRRLEVELYHAATPLGPFTAHPGNPLSTDDQAGGRNAGRVIPSDDGLLRFVQDGRTAYGTAVSARLVTALSADRFEEHAVADPLLGPGDHPWNAAGMHHVDAFPRGDGSWIALVDGRAHG